MTHSTMRSYATPTASGTKTVAIRDAARSRPRVAVGEHSVVVMLWLADAGSVQQGV